MAQSINGIHKTLERTRRHLLGALGAIVVSLALGVTIAWLLLSPTSRETLELSAYLGVSGLASLAFVEIALRRTRFFAGLRLRPKMLVASGMGLAITLVNTIALAVLMFVNAEHDLPMLISILAFAGGLGIYTGYRLAGHSARSLGALAEGAGRIAAGELSVRIPVESNDEVGELSEAFNEMATSLEEAMARHVQLEEGRKQLTAAVSHDLRTPLSSARAMLEALADGVVDTPEEQADYHRRMLNEIKILSELVDDLFDLSLLDVGAMRLDLRPTPLQDLVLETIESMRPAADRKRLTLKSRIGEDLQPVLVDPVRMRRVMMNLVQNAIRHTPADGTVAVEADDMGDEVVLEVRDTGEGIARRDLPRIWTRFFRPEDARGRDADGSARSGLGLAIAKAIVEIHGGVISVESEVGEGSVFRVRLPKPGYAA